MSSEPHHHPAMKQCLRPAIDRPGQPGLEVVDGREELSSTWRGTELETTTPAGFGEQAADDVEQLPVGAAAFRSKPELEQRASMRAGEIEATVSIAVDLDTER